MKRINPKAKAAVSLLAAAVMATGAPAGAKDSPALNIARQLNDAFAEVADQVSPAVVVIKIKQKVAGNENSDDGSFWDILPPEYRRRFQHQDQNKDQADKGHEQWLEGEGSGIIISQDGYILTNNHVVENADVIDICLKDGRKVKGEVKGTDPDSDLALVKINATGLRAAKLGDSDATRVGEFVLAIGAPFELNDTVTVGHVSAKGRTFEHDAYVDFIQTDAKILPGNSGGPLVNLYGEVIGINTMIEGLDTGIGFAVPINLAKRVKDHLMTEGKYTRSWLGIGIKELNQDTDYIELGTNVAPDVHDGVLVDMILPGGPASKSELQLGDVITAVDGKTVQTVRQLQDSVSAKKVGSVAVLDVVRVKKRISLKVTTGAKPTVHALAAQTEQPRGAAESSSLGLTVQSLTKDVADQYGVDANSGVLVTAVDKDSPADQQDIKAGDVITEINRKHVSTPRQFHDAVSAADNKRGLMVNLVSESGSRFVVLKDGGN